MNALRVSGKRETKGTDEDHATISATLLQEIEFRQHYGKDIHCNSEQPMAKVRISHATCMHIIVYMNYPYTHAGTQYIEAMRTVFPETLLYLSDYDLLRYNGKIVEGISTPYMYLSPLGKPIDICM